MSARLTPLRGYGQRIATRPGYVARAWRWVRCMWLRARICWTEDWLRDCARDGITDSLNLREFRRELEAMRCALATLEAGHG